VVRTEKVSAVKVHSESPYRMPVTRGQEIDFSFDACRPVPQYA
jgi:hypothetical protein